ncbi:TnsA endonuclease N-terminal domain-containing protein [Bacillus sp. JJ1127]|uniref:TnsA endonuclease N-terminal domain-containing protein n=1 Tax=Bacillus sp. JJ1127 TaxID=3122952 RepID=UPI002FFE84E6
MLNESEFLSWCARNNFPKRTEEYINKSIRSVQPARLVGTGNRSLSGKYPSRKMGMYIQWESGKVEGPAVLMLENDEDVIEYYDQPNKIKINFIDSVGRKRGLLYTPDFFVIRKDSAGWEEWKTDKDLNILSKKQPWKYIKDENGNWRCPPGEKFAHQFGLQFIVRSDKEINWNLHRNYVFLDSYLRKVDLLDNFKNNYEEIKEIILSNPGITLKQLLIDSQKKGIYSDNIYALIILQSIYIDLSKNVLAESEKVQVFLDKENADMYSNVIECEVEVSYPSRISLEIGEDLLWDGVMWKVINMGQKSIAMLSEDNRYNDVPRELIENMIKQGKITSDKKNVKSNNEVIEIIKSASEEEYKIANYRLKYVKEYINKEFVEGNEKPKLRTLRDWVAKYRKATKLFGNGYVGLLPNDKYKGNKTERLDAEIKELMNHYILKEYETLIEKNKSVVWGAFAAACEEKGLIAPSLQTFCNYINNRPQEQQIKKMKGPRAAYQVVSTYWELEMTTPKHGDFPLNIAHLDHTELDIELVSSQTGKNLGRPYLTLMTDAYSRRVLAFYMSFETPSYRSCLMAFRDCVKRYNRLPQQIVVDNGKEFHSVYFETFLAMYEREIKRRPSAQPRFGSIIERFFGTTNTAIIHNLQGNTKIMKNVRQVTSSINPKTQALWTLPRLTLALEYYFYEIYDNFEHPALGQTPRESFQTGLLEAGERAHEFIQYDALFRILTLPSAKSSETIVQTNRGVRINYLNYWNDEFKNPKIERDKVKVRYDPFNIGEAYAYVNKKWVKCISENYSVFNNLSEKELKYITAEIRKSKQLHSKRYTINAREIAGYLKKLENDEQFILLQEKIEDAKNAINLLYNGDSTQTVESVQKEHEYSQKEHFEEDNSSTDLLEIFEEF